MRLGGERLIKVDLGRLGKAIYQPGDQIHKKHMDRLTPAQRDLLISEAAHKKRLQRKR